MLSIVQDDWEHCYFPDCSNRPTDTHHLFGGARRKHSERDGLKIHVCRQCHIEIHEGEACFYLQTILHKVGQRRFEETRTREEFMERYGRNYL